MMRLPLPWAILVGTLTLLVMAPALPLLGALLSPEAWAALSEDRLRGLFGQTATIAGGAALLAVAVGFPLALLTTRLAVPGSNLASFVLPLPLLLPPLLLAQAWHGWTGMDGPWAALFTLGLAYAPFPALFAARALRRQARSAHESALLLGGPCAALKGMLRTAWPATLLGGMLAFLFSATDFAVPDYFAAVGPRFSVFAAEIFHHWRNGDPVSGTVAAVPLVTLVAIVLWVALSLRDKMAARESAAETALDPLPCGRARLPLGLLLFALLSLLLFLPLGRIFLETGLAGPLAEGTWAERSGQAFADALQRGRADLLRSLRTAALAAFLCLLLAPIWVDVLARARPRLRRLSELLLSLPLLVPAVGLGLGALHMFDRPELGYFAASPWFPPLVMAGRFLPLALFLLMDHALRVPRSREESALLAGLTWPARLWRVWLGPHAGTWFMTAGLVAIFAIRELDLAILLPAANASAAVRYYNALHFARDGFVAAFGLLIASILFLPIAVAAVVRLLRSRS